MKKFLIIYALLATAAAWSACRWGCERNSEVRRLDRNGRVLSDSVLHYRTRLGEAAASVEALQLKCSEYARLRERDARRIRELGISLRRLEAASATAVSTGIEMRVPIVDTVTASASECRAAAAEYDSVRLFGWSDEWVSISGRIVSDSVECSVVSIDTLHQIVHRVPRRFLFIRYGTKAVRQEMVSSNPHTRIVSTEYIEFEPRRRRKHN